MNIKDLLPKPANSVWDSYVPLITDKNKTIAYITNEIAEPCEYNELCYRLKTASEAEVFTLVINTPGGIIDSALMLIDAIKQSPAKVIADISGTVASAGTIITLACDEVIVADHTAFMIHNYSASGISGKAHELKAYQAFSEKSLENAFRTFYKGFLSEKEMNAVIDGQDLWMGSDDILSRLPNLYASKLEPNLSEPKSVELVEEDDTSTKRRGRPKKQ